MGLLYKLSVKLINFLIFFFMIVYLPGIPYKTTFPFEPFEITPPRELKGALELNNLLDNAERLFEDKIYGPEAFLVRGNDLYATIHGGEVVKINGKHITHVAKFGKPCEFAYEEDICGRPLGMAFDTQGNNLIVADAYFGIWSVDLTNGEKKQIIAPDAILDGKDVQRRAKVFNSVAVTKNGDIYWTDSSSDFGIQDGIYAMLANPSGRLFHFSRATKINKVLIDNIFFANGVVLSPNEDFVLVSETGKGTIRRYYIAGPKKGTEDIFIDGLPGNTDNLIADAEGIWAPLVMAVDSDYPSLIMATSKVPLIRKFVLRLLALLELPFKLVDNVFPNMYTKKIIHALGHFELLTPLRPPRATVVRLDWNGHVVGSLHGFDRSVEGISHVAELGDYLYLGSPFNKYLARVKMPRAPKIRVKEMSEAEVKAKPTVAPKVEPKVTTPKPAPKVEPKVEATTPKPAPKVEQKVEVTTQKPSTPKPTTEAPKVVPTTKAPKVKTTPEPTTQAPPKLEETTPAVPKVEETTQKAQDKKPETPKVEVTNPETLKVEETKPEPKVEIPIVEEPKVVEVVPKIVVEESKIVEVPKPVVEEPKVVELVSKPVVEEPKVVEVVPKPVVEEPKVVEVPKLVAEKPKVEVPVVVAEEVVILQEAKPIVAPPKVVEEKIEVIDPEPPKVIEEKIVVVESEPPKVEAQKPEPPKVEVQKPEPPKEEVKAPKPLKTEEAKPEPLKVDKPIVEDPKVIEVPKPVVEEAQKVPVPDVIKEEKPVATPPKVVEEKILAKVEEKIEEIKNEVPLPVEKVQVTTEAPKTTPTTQAPKPKTTPPMKPTKSATKPPETPKDPAPIVEKIPDDVPNPDAVPEKLKVINKEGQPEEIPVQ